MREPPAFQPRTITHSLRPLSLGRRPLPASDWATPISVAASDLRSMKMAMTGRLCLAARMTMRYVLQFTRLGMSLPRGCSGIRLAA
jgi:hypothetical protein